MSRDRREQILQRLLALLGEIEGISAANVVRNEADLSDVGRLPAAVLLDGNEVVALPPGKRGPGVPTLVTLTPQIFVVLKPRENMTNVGVGEELSAFRVKVLKAIIGDATLEQLLGGNGYIEYRGTSTDMNSGSTVEGSFQMDFSFTYVFNPSEL